MKPFTIFLIILFGPCPLYAQLENTVLHGPAPTDTQTILATINQAKKLAVSYPDSALKILRDIQRKSEAIHFSTGAGLSLLHQGIIETNQQNLSRARLSFRQSEARLKGSAAGSKHLYMVYNNLGNIAFLSGDYEAALSWQYKAIETGLKFEGTDLSPMHVNIASILMHTGRDAEHIKTYLKKAIISARQKEDFSTLGKIYNNIALAFSLEKQWDSSLSYFRKSLAIAENHKLPAARHLSISNIGIIYLEQNQIDSAVHYLESARAMDTLSIATAMERARGALGVSYLKQQKFNKARPLLLEQYQKALQRNNSQDLRASYYNLSKLYGATGNFKQGYDHAWNYILTNDSIAGAEIIRKVHAMEIKHNTKEKEKQLLLSKLKILEQQKALQVKNKWLSISLISGALLLIIVVLLFTNYQNRKKLQGEKLKNIERQKALETMKASIDGEENERNRIAKELHDGVGALISATSLNLSALARDNVHIGSQETFQSTLNMVEEIGKELRLTAHNLMPIRFATKSLSEAIVHFCKAASKGSKLRIEVLTFGDFSGLPHPVQLNLYRIIQELVNNIVKHAQAEKALVQMIFQNELLSITVEDNGKGFDPKADPQPEGIGMQSLQSRVKSMQGDLLINSSPQKGTSVYIEFDFNPANGLPA